MTVYTFTEGRRLVLSKNAVEQMRRHTQNSIWKREAGGAMLGRHLAESPDLVIDEVTTPQAKDLRSRFSFFRSSEHNQVAKQRWQKSLGKIAYLGLWHTHPENIPSPSEIDLHDWAKAVRNDGFEGEFLFFCIVGISKINLWAGNRQLEFKLLKSSNEQ